ncbi:uncharacterized protein EV422DRAFT_534879 [Fimicolochytrium jonesii]|uniref:uncharacterized protein n=1 Tax=Fimicolochytrium jonesii TaxID=1396493 RepID=UPI0022FEDCEA|nr:uncharacterized protein EV422DRAFT_534879 [Fimicolochytrium jonesii]KAI8819475.1 hypothetical protein EV422DRAFT_534879 [Fimicolochytrium jonesii]
MSEILCGCFAIFLCYIPREDWTYDEGGSGGMEELWMQEPEEYNGGGVLEIVDTGIPGDRLYDATVEMYKNRALDSGKFDHVRLVALIDHIHNHELFSELDTELQNFVMSTGFGGVTSLIVFSSELNPISHHYRKQWSMCTHYIPLLSLSCIKCT